MALEVQFVTLGCIFVFALVLQNQTCVEEDGGILQVILATQGRLIAICRTRIIDQAIAFSLTEGHVTFQFAIFLGTEAAITLFVDIRRLKVLADSKFLVRPFDPLLNRTGGKRKEQCAEKQDYYMLLSFQEELY